MTSPDTLQKTVPSNAAAPAAATATAAAPPASTKPAFNYAAAASSASNSKPSGVVATTDLSNGAAKANVQASNQPSTTSSNASSSINVSSMNTTGPASQPLNHTSSVGSSSNAAGAGAGASVVNEGATLSTSGSGRGSSPVSIAKRSMATGSNASINFGTPHEQDSMLSSSPAGPAQLGPNAPTKFGTVEADSGKINKDKVVGMAGKGESGSHAPTRSLDLNKLFQGTPQTPVKSPLTNGSVAGEQSARNTPTTSSSTLRASAGGQRPFEPQRSPSQPFHPMNAQQQPAGAGGSRGPSGVNAGAGPHIPYAAHHPGGPQQQQQQPRSPHMGHQPNMQPMPPMGAPPHWQGQQMYYSNMYHQPYGYPGMPQQQHPHQMGQQWAPPQAGYEGNQGQPRSPRHMPASPMGVHPGTPQQNGAMQPSTPGMSSNATASMSSPAASQRSVPPTPTTNPSSLASPPAGTHQFGMGHPPVRNANYQGPPSAGYAHSPSHSFAGGMNSMSPSARQFEPAQKRISSAIKIVNPDTHAAIDLKAARETSSPAPGTPTAGTAHPAVVAASPTPSARKAEKEGGATSGALTPSISSSSNAAKIDTTESFMARVKAAAAESKKAKAEAVAGVEKEAAEKKAREEAEKVAEEERLAKAKAEEEKAKKLQEDKVAAEAAEKAAEEKKAQAEAEAASQQAKEAAEKEVRLAAETKAADEAAAKAAAEEQEAKQASEEAEAANEAATASMEKKGVPAPIDTSITVTEAQSEGDDEDDARDQAGKEAPMTPSFRNSVADVERMAREASSVPSTPLDGNVPRLPTTPRTPGTPGFAHLPAKPVTMSSIGNAIPSNGLKLDGDALEKKKRPVPSQLDLSASQARSASTGDVPMSAASAALGSARFIDDITKVSYPDKIQSPKPELNESAEPGKFRYDRDFLLQFMGVYKEKPTDLPPLAQIGMDSSQAAGGRGAAGRRSSGMGPPAAPGRPGSQIGLGLGGGFGAKAGGMGQFQHAPKTSEERFAQSNARGSVGAFGSSGPMGSFNAGARSQPLSRTGSGSNAIPSRDAMGSGIPSGGRAGSRRGRERRDPNSRSQVNPPEKGGPTIPMDQVVPLQASDKRWIGGRGASKPEGPEMVTRKVKALLNKLTMEKFDSISLQILEWANKSINEKDGQTLRMVIALIFEKATDEAAWSEMYAALCRKILEELNPDIQDENLKTNDNRPVSGGHLFRKYLLNRCQEDFERGWAQRDSTAAAAKSKEAEDLAKKAENEKHEEVAKEAEAKGEKQTENKETELLSEEYYEAQKAKRRGLGLVRFIGELFKLSMLTEKIMHICIQRLLSNAQDPEEEEIESLCKLLTTVGKLLASGKAANYVDVYFTRIHEIMKNGAMNSRMKFMLQDVIDLRSSGWVPRHDNAAPKTIAQIHEDAAKQKAQAEADSYARQRGNMGGPMSRGGSRRGQPRDQYGPDGFITVGNQPAAPPHQIKAGNLSGFGKGIDRSASSRPLSVGPQSVFAKKNQKSDDGSNPPSRTASSQNIFSLLSSTNEAGGDAAAAQQEEAGSGRPKLNLAKRTKPLPSQDGGAEDDKKEDEIDEVEGEAEKEVEDDMSDEQAAKKIDNDIKEFLEIKDIDEGTDALEALPMKRRSDFLGKIVETTLGKKEEDVEAVAQLFSAGREKGLLDDETVEAGFKDQVEFLADIAIDVPSAFKFMAILLVSSGLPSERIEAMAETIQSDGGLTSPKDRFMSKVNEQLV